MDFSLVVASRGYSLVAMCGFLTVVMSTQPQWCTALVALWHVESLQTRD